MLLSEIKNGAAFKRLITEYRDKKFISVFGLRLLGRAAFISSLEGGTLSVAADFVAAQALYDEVAAFDPTVRILPAKDDVLGRYPSFGENTLKRFETLAYIAQGKCRNVITTADALMQLYPIKQRLLENIIEIKKGESVKPEKLTAKLVACGYKREEQIADMGQFALRGYILDVWTPTGEAWRIEFFGDEVDCIRALDTSSQLSGQEIQALTVSPFTDVFLSDTEAETAASEIVKAADKKLPPEFYAKANSIAGDAAARIVSGDRSASLGFWSAYFPHCSLMEFCQFDNVVFDEGKQIVDNARMRYTEHKNRYAELLRRGEVFKKSFGQMLQPEDAFSLKEAAGGAVFQSVLGANKIFEPKAVLNFKTDAQQDYSRDFSLLSADIKNWIHSGYKVFVCPYKETKGVLAEAFRRDMVSSENVIFSDEIVPRGCLFHDDKISVIGARDLKRAQQKKTVKRDKSDVFNEPKPGDYVVHETHGIGFFKGMTRMTVGGVLRDYLEIDYSGGSKLYLPAENMDSLSRYVGGESPKLSKLGGQDFAKLKEKVKKSVRKLAIDLASLYAERLKTKGYKYSEDDSLLKDFESSFEFTETDDQLAAINDAIGDLKSGKVMDRLLCGDVGYGKTEVALRVAFKVIAEGKQVAFMSPTTILAGQHFETVKKRMEPFGIKAGRLTRFDSAAEQKNTLRLLKENKIDIVIGTHRLLSKDVQFYDLGLLVLDEEQRFGVADKEKIKNLKKDVNVLTLSATPIPRTLNLSLSGIRDISILDTPPVERIPVQTYVMEYSEALVIDAVTREVNRGGQVFIVYNRVSGIDSYTVKIRRLLPDFRIICAHGQMAEGELEKAVTGFAAGESDVLIASTIIENGIDIVRANTMIVTEADKLGLSQLYQLKGRVGRGNRLAYVFFTYDGERIISADAYKRLEAITEYTEFGSGFKIAMRDLEIRGAGTVMGAEQHGHMEKVGYDMYLKLLNEASKELSGEIKKERKEVRISTDYDVFLPDWYIKDKDWRYRIYSRAAKISSLTERDKLITEITDIYGKAPESVLNLINSALIKNLAEKLGASAVILNKKECGIIFDKLKDADENAVSKAMAYGGETSLSEKPEIKFKNATAMLKFLLS